MATGAEAGVEEDSVGAVVLAVEGDLGALAAGVQVEAEQAAVGKARRQWQRNTSWMNS